MMRIRSEMNSDQELITYEEALDCNGNVVYREELLPETIPTDFETEVQATLDLDFTGDYHFNR